MPELSRRAEVLGQLLKRIGNFDKMRSFEDRLILQKTIYFLQNFGLYFGYRFSWYVYGPYSPSLASDGFDLAEHYDQLPSYEFADEDAEERFEQFLAFLGEKRSDPQWLEALASVHSLRRLYPRDSQEEIVKRVARKQPYFSEEQARQAWEYLDRHNLLDQ